MSTQTTNNQNQTVATAAQAALYIEDALIHGKLEMKQACKDLGWSFPRIRSKAKTVCKKLNGTFVKEARGVYFLQTNNTTQVTPAADETDEMKDSADPQPQPTPEEIEAAIMSAPILDDSDEETITGC